MPRPLYGFRQRDGTIVPEPDELAVVVAVLTAPRGQRRRAARRDPRDSDKAVARRVERILAHAALYRAGRVLLGLPPNPRLARLVTKAPHAR